MREDVVPSPATRRVRFALPARDTVAIVGLTALSVGLLLALASRLTFWGDEWNFWFDPPASPFRPNNEHWSTGVYFAYAALDALGVRTYLPFMSLLVATHALAALGLWALVRPRVGPWPSIGVMAVLLFLGSSSENLLWAWQVGFLGATGLGLWGLVALDRGRQPLAGLLLLGAVATQGPGLFFPVVAIAWRPNRWLALPVVSYVAWFLMFGREAIGALQDPFAPASLVAAPGFAIEGIAHAAGGTAGLPAAGGAVLLLMALAGGILLRPERLFWAAGLGVASEYVLIGLVRSGIEGSVTLSRYVYPAAAMLLVMAATLAPTIRRPTLRLALAALLVVACLSNVSMLMAAGIGSTDRYTLDEPYGCLPGVLPGGPATGSGTAVEVPRQFRCL